MHSYNFLEQEMILWKSVDGNSNIWVELSIGEWWKGKGSEPLDKKEMKTYLYVQFWLIHPSR